MRKKLSKSHVLDKCRNDNFFGLMGYEMKEYYNQDGIRVRSSTKADVAYLKDHLRESDKQEIWASHNKTPEESLKIGLQKSIFCCTVENSNPIAMFGIVPENILGQEASVWMLATDDLKKIKRRFARNSKVFVHMMLEYYSYLYNFVDDRNKESIKWLKYLGAKFEEPRPYGKEGKPFRFFSFRREDYV